jgi:hypothetical protein
MLFHWLKLPSFFSAFSFVFYLFIILSLLCVIGAILEVIVFEIVFARHELNEHACFACGISEEMVEDLEK